MTSVRFPGKVLAPFCGRPLISWVVDAATAGLGPAASVVVVTSVDGTDDPLAAYLAAVGVPCFRGPLHDVLARFVAALDVFQCDWVLRLSADSPLLSPRVVTAVAFADRDHVDLLTTIFPRRLPKGQNAELVRAELLREMNRRPLTAEQREHVTKGFYDAPSQYRIVSVAPVPELVGQPDMAVDDLDDLARIQVLAGRLPIPGSVLRTTRS
jgi:spore coat polysaccharide biosynthesis protein SpsF